MLTGLAANATMADAFAPGTYRASASGINGAVTVSVTLSADRIETVEVVSHKETEDIGTVAAARLPEAIVRSQSTHIDAVSGASMTSKAILTAVEDCLTQAGADPAALKAAGKRATDDSAKAPARELTGDIIVIGGGAAGMSAAVKATDLSAKVILLEKMPFAGGASAICGGQYAVQGSKLQKEKGVTYDPPQALVYDLIDNGHLHNDLTTLKLLAENSPAAADWAIERFSIQFVDQPLQYRAEFQFDRSIYLKGGCNRMFHALLDEARKAGVEIHTETKAERLIVENDRVTGVKARGADGTLYTVKGKAVLLATGGYGANKDMLAEPLKSSLYYGPVSSTGDGHRMAQEIGAPLQLMQFGKRYPNGIETAPGIAKSVIQGNYRAWEESGILVNAKGERVTNEKASNNIMQVLEKQPGQLLYLLMDQRTFDAFRNGVHSLGITGQEIDGWFAANGTKAPVFAHGKPLEATAEAAGIDAAALKETIARYNSFVKTGKDADFGRPAAFLKGTIAAEGPYYLVEQKPRFATTMESVIVNDRLQVLNKEGQIIEGLYAAGEIINAVHGVDSSPGMNVAWSLTSGKLVAESMVRRITGK